MRDRCRQFSQGRNTRNMGKLGLRFRQGFLGLLSFLDVGVGLERGRRLATLVTLMRPPARNRDLRPITLGVNKLSLPITGPQQLRGDLFIWGGEVRLHQAMGACPTASLPDHP